MEMDGADDEVREFDDAEACKVTKASNRVKGRVHGRVESADDAVETSLRFYPRSTPRHFIALPANRTAEDPRCRQLQTSLSLLVRP